MQRIFHRDGVRRWRSMMISGHRTRAIFDRYNIVSEDDLRAAITKTEAYVSTLPTERISAPIRQARE